ncbi:histone acetyltransferase HPA2 and related acetyltransferases [alpha proteobacterium U9-1i]|nr:histone acetyltransferase HPA2 and related acetyltransferases [alpha proteobacterium U9-1i]
MRGMSASITIEQPSESDLDVIHAALSETYWSPGIPRETVARAFRNSLAALARNERGDLVGFARLVTDKATFAWLCDVVVLPGYQGQGIARSLVQAFQAQPDLQGLRRWLLGTKDAHGVYAALGFQPLDAPQRLMHIMNTNPYGTPVSL